jgi:hypothetical protein
MSTQQETMPPKSASGFAHRRRASSNDVGGVGVITSTLVSPSITNIEQHSKCVAATTSSSSDAMAGPPWFKMDNHKQDLKQKWLQSVRVNTFESRTVDP